MNDNDLHQLATPFALDAIGDEERRRFEAHLDGCHGCRQTVAAVRETLGDLAEETAVAPPVSMRDSVMQRIARTPQDAAPREDASSGSPTPVPPPRQGETHEAVPAPREAVAPPDAPVADDTTGGDVIPLGGRRRWAALVTAAAGIAAVFIAAVLVLGGDTAEDVIAAPDARVIEVEAPAGTTASLTFSPDRMQAVFTADDLADPGDDSTYQLWVIAGDVPRPAGTFVPDDDGSVQVLLDEEVETGQIIGLTIEPEGGSPAPTGDILVAQPVT